MLAACLLGKMSTKWLIFGTPLWFGIGGSTFLAFTDEKLMHTTATSDGRRAATPAAPPSDHLREDVSACTVLKLTTSVPVRLHHALRLVRGLQCPPHGCVALQLPLLTHTGSIIPAIVSHTFCNYTGIDLPTSAAQRHPSKKLCGYFALSRLTQQPSMPPTSRASLPSRTA